MLWSVRRELWEHRWLWIVPLMIGTIVVAVFAGVAGVHAGNAQNLSGLFDLASRMLLMTGTIVSFVYCAEALHGERRDRAILFWKSWPVGDGTTVTAKAMVAMLVVPALTLALLLGAQVIARFVLVPKGVELHAPMGSPAAAALEVFAATLWIAPVYAWIMVVSAWARRAVLLVAFLPALLVSILEAMTRGDGAIGHALFYRGVGRHWPMNLSVDFASRGPMIATPAPELLRSPALWAGVLLAALLLGVVARLRRTMMALS
jgi:ABC-2 type transport system permease protein